MSQRSRKNSTTGSTRTSGVAAKPPGASLNPSTFVSGRDWLKELGEYARLDKTETHRASDRFPAHVKRSLKQFAAQGRRDFGETAAFTIAKAAPALLGFSQVNEFAEAAKDIDRLGTAEDSDWAETFKFTPEAEDGVKRFDVRLTKEEAHDFATLCDFLGMSIQNALLVCCLFVLRESPGVREDWRERMHADFVRWFRALKDRVIKGTKRAAELRPVTRNKSRRNEMAKLRMRRFRSRNHQ